MLSAALLRAYRKTAYSAGGAIVFIGARSPAMDAILRTHGARQAAFVTAHNPRSRKMPPGWNRRMQARLTQRLRRRALLPAGGHWRNWAEAHLLVLGDTRPTLRLARCFRQHAIVIVRRGQPARLPTGFSPDLPSTVSGGAII